MAGSSRSPHLAVPFTVVGAAAGWLCAVLLQNPWIVHVRPAPPWGVALVTAVVAGLAGALHTRVCARDPSSANDEIASTWALWDASQQHALIILGAGALAGGLCAGIFDAYTSVAIGTAGGFGCAVAFLPVCFAVLFMAQRAQRARMGSLVASSDRRAVWGILLTALAITTVGALPNWPSWLAGDTTSQAPIVALLAASAIGIGAALAADVWTLRRAKKSLADDLVPKHASEVSAVDTKAPRLDLGLGDDLAAKMARTAAAYRGQDRPVALIVGTPNLALSALHASVRRGAVGVALVAFIAGLHALASSSIVQIWYDHSSCLAFDSQACERVGDHLAQVEPGAAAQAYTKACSRKTPKSCHKAAALLHARASGPADTYGDLKEQGPKQDRLTAIGLDARGCRYGDREACAHAPR